MEYSARQSAEYHVALPAAEQTSSAEAGKGIERENVATHTSSVSDESASNTAGSRRNINRLHAGEGRLCSLTVSSAQPMSVAGRGILTPPRTRPSLYLIHPHLFTYPSIHPSIHHYHRHALIRTVSQSSAEESWSVLGPRYEKRNQSASCDIPHSFWHFLWVQILVKCFQTHRNVSYTVLSV